MKLLSHPLNLFFCCLLFLSMNAFAQVSPLSQLLNQTTSMQADFVQTVYDNHGKAVQQSFGKMALLRPGKFRWQVTKPLPQLIIANGARLWIYDPDLQQVTIRSLDSSKGETPALLLSHEDNALDKEFTIKALPDSKDAQVFELTPKSKSSMFESIQMSFNQHLLQKMRLQDHLGHHTLIEFKNTKTNVPMPATSFVFKAPPNVDVIDETRKK